MIGGKDRRTLTRDVFAPNSFEAEVDMEKRLEESADRPIDKAIGSVVARAGVVAREVHTSPENPAGAASLQFSTTMAINRARTLRGALAGGTAAIVWAAQQPLDKRAFNFYYDDVEFLGKAITRSSAWPVVGLGAHLLNGALFGALYANVAPLVPMPRWAKGPAAAMVENFALWPAVRISDRLHPARDEMPSLAGDRRALAQATWRHLLFGVVLGEIERRINIQAEPEFEFEVVPVSSNGHANCEHTYIPEQSH